MHLTARKFPSCFLTAVSCCLWVALTSLVCRSRTRSGRWFCSSAVWGRCGHAPCNCQTRLLLPQAQPGIKTQQRWGINAIAQISQYSTVVVCQELEFFSVNHVLSFRVKLDILHTHSQSQKYLLSMMEKFDGYADMSSRCVSS